MTGPDWSKRDKDINRLPPRIDVDGLTEESTSYQSVKCSTCEFKETCPLKTLDDSGCRMRKEIYDKLFTQMEFKTDDAISLNRIRLISRYYIELILRRNFGAIFSKSEVQMVKTLLLELSKLSIDKKGELLNTNQKNILPWEASEDDAKLREQLEKTQKLEMEVEELRKLKKKKVKKK